MNVVWTHNGGVVGCSGRTFDQKLILRLVWDKYHLQLLNDENQRRDLDDRGHHSVFAHGFPILILPISVY